MSDEDVVETRHGRSTSPARTCVDLARGIGVAHLAMSWRIAWVDAVLHMTRVPVEAVLTRAYALRRLRGMRTAAHVLAQCRPGAESVRETLLRLLVIGDGFPEPDLQVLVDDRDGHAVARLDMAWPEHRAGAEYDGAHHRERTQHSRDLYRHNDLRATGWRVLQVDDERLRRPGAFLSHLEAIVPRARSRPPALPDLWRPNSGHLWRW